MNIRDWPMGAIMQLPDCCFGRRFLVTCSIHTALPVAAYDISELALPEKAVVWEFFLRGVGVAEAFAAVRLALGDQLPPSVAAMDALEPLFRGWGLQGPDPRIINIDARDQIDLRRLRMPLSTAGRRLILELVPGITGIKNAETGIVVSSIPTEVPDCLVSEYLRSQS